MITMIQQKHKDQKIFTLDSFSIYKIIKHNLDNDLPVTITVTGNSMIPFLYHMRDQVTLVFCITKNLMRGDIVLYRRTNGQYVLHRIYQINEDQFTLIGDAQWTLEKGIEGDQIIARVDSVKRKGMIINCRKGRWNVLMKLYLYRMKAPIIFRTMIKLIFIYPKALLRRLF